MFCRNTGLFYYIISLTIINLLYLIMEEKLKEQVERRIASMGYKKEFVAKQIGLDKVRFSQTLSGVRKITSDEKSALLRFLGI